MTLRFRHSISVVEGVRLTNVKRVINLSDITRVQAWSWSDNDPNSQNALLTMPTSGLHYRPRFGNSNAHNNRAFKQHQLQKWLMEFQECVVTLANNDDISLSSLTISVNSEGQLQFKTSTDNFLSDADVENLWEKFPKVMLGLLESQAKELNGVLRDYLYLSAELPLLDEVTSSYTPVTFAEKPPKRPEPLSYPPEPICPNAPSVKLWHRLIPKKQQSMARAYQKDMYDWQTAKLRWKSEVQQIKLASDRARQRYKAYISVWKARKQAHEVEQQVYAEQFQTLMMNDESLMTEVLIAELNQLDWPQETHINFQLDLDTRTLWLDFDLPSFSNVSTKSANVLIQTRSLRVKEKTEQQRLTEYVAHINTSVLRLISLSFAALPAISDVVISAHTYRKDTSTGFDRDEYLVSVRAGREKYDMLSIKDLKESESRSVLENFELKQCIDSNSLKAVQPFEPAPPVVAC